MPDTRNSGAPRADQVMTIPDHIAAALKAAGRFEVGSTVHLPDRDQTLRVVRLDFTSGKTGSKGVWLRWGSQCVECGAAYEFTTKRTFAYPTRTCPDHRRTSRQRIARVAPQGGGAVSLRRVVADVLDGLSLLCDGATQAEVEDAVIAQLPSAERGSIWEVAEDVTGCEEAAGWLGIQDGAFVMRFGRS